MKEIKARVTLLSTTRRPSYSEGTIEVLPTTEGLLYLHITRKQLRGDQVEEHMQINLDAVNSRAFLKRITEEIG